MTNLEYVTPKENVRRAFALGLRPVGELAGAAKLTEIEAEAVRSLKGQVPAWKLAELLGVTKATIDAIFQGKTWTHLKTPLRRVRAPMAGRPRSSQ